MSRHPVIDRSDPQTDTNLRAAILSIGNILHVGGMPDSVVDHLLDRARMTLTPAQRLDPSSAYTTQVLGQITGFVKETYGLDRLLNIHGPAGRPGADAGTGDAGSFFDARGLTRLDRLGAGSTAAYFGYGYSSLNTRWDPSSGAAGLTAANFGTTDFARAGLDLSTTRLLFGQGFTPTQILQAANLTNELGIDIKGNVAAVARLTRDVKGAATSLRTMRDFQNQIDAEEEKARLARERGDHTAAAEHEKKAEDARRRQKEFEERERARIARENPDRVGDWDKAAGAIKGESARIDSDLKAGRITQEQADEQRKALTVQAGTPYAAQAAKVTAEIEAETRAAADPNAPPPKRATEVAETITNVVQPAGVTATAAAVGDMFDGGDAAAAPTDPSVKAAGGDAAPAEQVQQTAEAKPPEDTKRKIIPAANGMAARV